MSTIQAELNRLESWLHEEIAAKQRAFALVERQEAAIRKNCPEDLEAASQAIDREVHEQSARDARRQRIFVALGGQWGVSAETLTLSSIAERAGAGGARVQELQRDLRRSLAELLKRNRRLHLLVKVQRQLIQDMLTTIWGGAARAPFAQSGNLVDAEV